SRVANLTAVSRLTDYRPPADKKDLLTQVADARWTAAEGRTEIELDIDAGRPLEAKSEVTLAGFLTLPNAGTVYRGRVTLEQKVTTKLLDRLPPRETKEMK